MPDNAFSTEGGKYLMRVERRQPRRAGVDRGILGSHIQSKRAEVTVETAPKWPGDVGGSPYIDRWQAPARWSSCATPTSFDPDIVDVFNTNTFHFDAASALDRDFDLGWYFVEKSVDGRSEADSGRAARSARLTKFLKSNFLRVKRTGPTTRFFPIKTPDDLTAGRDEIAEIYPD